MHNRGRNAHTNQKVSTVQNRSCIRYKGDYNEEETYKVQLIEVKITQKRRQLKEGDRNCKQLRRMRTWNLFNPIKISKRNNQTERL